MFDYEPFQKAVPVWADGEEKTMNLTCVFAWEFGDCGEFTLRAAASCFYRAFLNGKLVAYGPARAAHGVYRVDEIKLQGEKGGNRLFIEVAGYNCKSFYSLDQPSFLQAEVEADGKIIFATDEKTDCRVFRERYRKVARFSFQRSFTESYRFDLPPQEIINGAKFAGTKVRAFACKKYLPRNVAYPDFKAETYRFVEKGRFFKASEDKFGDVRYLTLDSIGIFRREELEIAPFDDVYGYGYKKEKCGAFDGRLHAGEYAVFRYPVSITGFLSSSFRAEEDSVVYVVFEEIDNREEITEDQPIAVDFWRNDTLNVISYEVKKGEFRHISFEPYTARYVKILVVSGSVSAVEEGLVRYENPETKRLVFRCDDEKLNAIVEAARNTLAQNAVDVLTDCPSRERAGWLCDSYFSARAEKLFTGGNTVERNFLENYAFQPEDLGLGKGILAMCYPADFGNVEFIPNWMLFYLLELADCFIRTDDVSLIGISEQKAREVVRYFRQFENEFGLLEDLSNWVFVEWSKAGDAEYVKGVNFPSNMLYAAALESFGKLYGDRDSVKKASQLREKIRELSYNGEFFEDNMIRKDGKLVLSGNISETCQYYAFYFGTADKNRYPRLYRTLVEKFGPSRDEEKVYPNVAKSNAFIGNMLRSDYLARQGLGEKFLESAKGSYYKMASVTGTLWEHDRIRCSLNHGFGSYAANMIVLVVSGFVGVNETEKVVRLRKETVAVRYRISVPVKGGFVTMENSDGTRKVTLPEGYRAAEE